MSKSAIAIEDENGPAFPETPQQITPAWMTWALRRNYPAVEVLSVNVVDIMAATATKVRIKLTYDDAGAKAGLPPTMIVKGAFSKNVDDMEHTFTSEMQGYRDIVSGIGLNTPLCYFAGKQKKNPLMVLEDLSAEGCVEGCVFGSVHVPLTFDQAASVLDSLAKMHARYWQHPALADGGEFSWMLRTVSGWHWDYMQMVLQPEKWASYIKLPRGAAIPYKLASDPARIERALEKQWAFHRSMPETLGHGDSHVANMYFNSRGGGLLDWEMRRCPWFHDFTYFLVSALDVVDRRKWEQALLQFYLGRLKEYGVAASPSFDEAFYCYQRDALYGYVIFVTNGDGTQFWTEAANSTAAMRFAMACEDHDSLALIERARR